MKPDKITIDKCTPDAIGEIMELQREIIAGLPCTEILRENTEEMLRSCLMPPNITLAARCGKELAAVGILFFPGETVENLADYLDGIETQGLLTANYKLCMVREKFRGNGLQYRLGEVLEEHAKNAGVKLMCATVSPKNSHSISNMERLGYKYNITTTKYGFERNIYYKFI